MAQPLEPFLKALQKGDSVKAASLVQKAWTKTYNKDSPKDPVLFYEKWLLQQAKWGTKVRYPVWDSQAEEKAIEAIDRALSFWSVLNQKQKAQYRKWQSDSTYLVVRKGIVDQDYVAAMLGAKYIAVHQIEYYLDQRPDTKFRQQLLVVRDSLAYLNLPKPEVYPGFMNNLREYETYLARYANSRWVKSVHVMAQRQIRLNLMKADFGNTIDVALGESMGSVGGQTIPDNIRAKLPKSLLDSLKLRRIQLYFPLNHDNLSAMVMSTFQPQSRAARNTFIEIWASEAMPNAPFGEGLRVFDGTNTGILTHEGHTIYHTCLPIPIGRNQWQWQDVTEPYLPKFDSVPPQALKQKWPGIIAGYTSGKLNYRFTVGDTILHAIDSLTYVGLGWYQLWKGGKARLNWVGDFYQIQGDVIKAKLLSNQVMLVRFSNQMSRIYSVLGLELSDYLKIDDAEILNPEGKGDAEILLLNQRSKFQLVILRDTYVSALRNRNREEDSKLLFDDVRLISNGSYGENNLLVTKGEEQGVWDGYRYIIPLGRYRITQGKKGWFLNSDLQTEYRLIENGKGTFTAEKMLPTRLAIAYRKEGKWGLLSYSAQVLQSAVYDTVQVLGSSVFLLTQGRTKVLSFGQDGLMDVSQFQKVVPLFPINPLPKRNEYVPDPAPFLVKTDLAGVKRVYNIKNKLILSEPVLSVDRPTDDLLIIRKQVIRYDTTFPTPAKNRKSKGKRKKPALLPLITQSIDEKVGLLDTAGKVILPFIYDGITLSDLGTDKGEVWLNLLANQRFGLASLRYVSNNNDRRVPEVISLIPPASDRSLRLLSKRVSSWSLGYLTERNGLTGIINWKGDSLIPNNYTDLVMVNSSLLMVRRSDTSNWEGFELKNQSGSSLEPSQPMRKIKSVINLEPNELGFSPFALSIAKTEDSLIVWKNDQNHQSQSFKIKATSYRLLKHGRLDYLVIWDGPVGQRNVQILVPDHSRLYQVPVPISEAMLNRLLQEED